MHQTLSGAHVLVRTSGPVDHEALRSEIRHALSRFVPDAEVSVMQVDAISRQDTGKLKRFVRLDATACPA